MGFVNKLFKKLGDKIRYNKKEEQVVIVHFNYLTDNLDALHNLEDKLEKIISERKVGEYDGNEIATDYSDGFLFMFGPNAEDLFKTVLPILENTDFIKGATARLIFGEPGSGAKEIEVKID